MSNIDPFPDTSITSWSWFGTFQVYVSSMCRHVLLTSTWPACWSVPLHTSFYKIYLLGFCKFHIQLLIRLWFEQVQWALSELKNSEASTERHRFSSYVCFFYGKVNHIINKHRLWVLSRFLSKYFNAWALFHTSKSFTKTSFPLKLFCGGTVAVSGALCGPWRLWLV